MTVTRDEMIKAIKAGTVPALRRLGFKGSYPHFYRDREGHVDLLTFQFSAYGGRLTAEISFATSSRDNLHPVYKDTPASKLRVYFTGKRKRLGADGYGDHWFIYDQPMPQYGEVAQDPTTIADQLATLAATQGDSWWSEMRVGS
ncbi:MAG: DUF4304 domain-containing protein [Alphaproteobacteria bacterium]|nr:MAG: DUF4304 domain-containing protein [Alphaproteobacteria bacterium]